VPPVFDTKISLTNGISNEPLSVKSPVVNEFVVISLEIIVPFSIVVPAPS